MNSIELVRTENLKRTFSVQNNEIDVLKGINLTIENGEFVAIMGKSGSGKTTLLKLLGLIDRPTDGKIYFKGRDSYNFRGDKLAAIRRCEIGFIYQDYYLMDSLSVLENIMLPGILNQSPGTKSFDDAKQLAGIMGIDHLLNEQIFGLSGGEKQRVAVCRALLNHPDLILADEPTGNLDSASSENVMAYLQMANKDMNTTIILVTHDAYIASFCNRVIFIKDGYLESEIVKEGSQEDFSDSIVEKYKEILRG